MKIISKYIKCVILFFIFITFFFPSCWKNDNKQNFSFKLIQDIYEKEVKSRNIILLCPFYIDKNFFDRVEEQINNYIVESDCYSIKICVNVDNGILDVSALYNIKNDVYFKIWKHNGEQKQTRIENPAALKILKKRPKDLVLIEDTKIPVLDSKSTYIIKKIGNKTYFYSYYYRPTEESYESIIDLFREGYEK